MVTVLLVRHADVDTTTGAPDSEPLSVKGQKRAQTLARVLGMGGIAAIFTSKVERTEKTAEPLAASLGLVTRDTPAPAALAAQIASGTLGAAILVVGHSNTVPKIIKALGGPLLPSIGHDKFDNLFVVTVAGPGTAEMVHLKYGEPAP